MTGVARRRRCSHRRDIIVRGRRHSHDQQRQNDSDPW